MAYAARVQGPATGAAMGISDARSSPEPLHTLQSRHASVHHSGRDRWSRGGSLRDDAPISSVWEPAVGLQSTCLVSAHASAGAGPVSTRSGVRQVWSRRAQHPAGRGLDGCCGATTRASAGRNMLSFPAVGAAQPTAPHARIPTHVVRQQGTPLAGVLCAAPRPLPGAPAPPTTSKILRLLT